MILPGTPQVALSFLIGSSVKATLLLALAAAAAYGLRKHSAAVRHQLWALGLVCSLLLPVVALLLPSWHSATLGSAVSLWSTAHAAPGNAAYPNLSSMIVDAATASSFSGQWLALILAVWALGAAFIAVKLLAGLTRLLWISAQATPITGGDWGQLVSHCSALGISRSVRLLQSRDASSMPSTWGVLRPRILLPASAAEWSAERRRIVLAHELAHVARHDWPLQICAELARGIYWFHPLVWFAAARLRNESERACDDSVLNSGVVASDYANQLLDLARTLRNAHRGWSVALAIARPTNVERRFIAMLNPNLNRRGLSRGAKLFARVAALCLLLPLAALRLPGQNLSGKFTGTIFDISDAACPNATIVMTNHKAGTVDMTTSDAEGNFVFKALPAGEYEMKVLKPGFATYLAPQVVLEPGRDLAMTAKLQMGVLEDTVDVQAEYRGQPYAMKTMPSTETTAEPKRIRIGGNVEFSKLITKVQPIYPASAKAAGVQGTVLLHAIVSKDGRPLALQVLNSQVNPDLARAAVEAVSQWRYEPTLLNGEPVEIDTIIQVNFKLLP